MIAAEQAAQPHYPQKNNKGLTRKNTRQTFYDYFFVFESNYVV
jgi:hypothetical protein